MYKFIESYKCTYNHTDNDPYRGLNAHMKIVSTIFFFSADHLVEEVSNLTNDNIPNQKYT